MKLTRAIELMEKYAECPQCGNGYVGDGEGSLEVTGNVFKRMCKCGWKIEIGIESG
jgi:predicted nucleic-acid-binding Zn-ribbon protein